MTHAWLIPAAGLSSCLLTYLIWRALDRRQIVDVPNERSMHKRPTPVGAGWAIVASVLLLWPATSVLPLWSTMLVVAAMLVLAGIGWIDDLWPLPPLLRFAVQALVVTICIVSLTGETLLLGGWLPRWLERLLTAVAWLWFINLYNFMDGIDGITGTETISIGLGYAVIAALTATGGMHTSLAFILIGAAAGFLVWNWHPARIFMGDVGSVPLGFLLGFLMLDLALRGQLAAALILPLYHLADATYTLIRRTLTVPEPWKPHRQHFYQRAAGLAGGSLSVPQVVFRIAGFNAFLILLAVKSIHSPWLALLLAGVGIAAMLVHLERASRPDRPTES